MGRNEKRCNIKLVTRDYFVSESRASGDGKYVKMVLKNQDNGDVITRTIRTTRKNLATLPAVGSTTPVRLAIGSED